MAAEKPRREEHELYRLWDVWREQPGQYRACETNPDGSSLELGTYLTGCGSPGIAVASDGSLYVGVAGDVSRSPARVLKLTQDLESLRMRR